MLSHFCLLIGELVMSKGIEHLFKEDKNTLYDAKVIETTVIIKDEELSASMTDSFQLMLCLLWNLHYKALEPTDFFYCPDIPAEIKKSMTINNTCLALFMNDGFPVVYYYEKDQIPFAANLHDDISKIRDDEAVKEKFKIETAIPFTDKLNQYIAMFTDNGTKPASRIYKNTSVAGYGGISRQQFSKLRNKKHISKRNVLLLAIGMKLTLEQTEDLLISDGFCFNDNEPFDAIVKDFIRKRNFNITELDYTLYKHTGMYLSAPQSDS